MLEQPLAVVAGVAVAAGVPVEDCGGRVVVESSGADCGVDDSGEVATVEEVGGEVVDGA